MGCSKLLIAAESEAEPSQSRHACDVCAWLCMAVNAVAAGAARTKRHAHPATSRNCCQSRSGYYEVVTQRSSPMAANGSQWQPMAANGSQWQPMAANGSQWQPMAANGSQWQPMAANGNDKWQCWHNYSDADGDGDGDDAELMKLWCIWRQWRNGCENKRPTWGGRGRHERAAVINANANANGTLWCTSLWAADRLGCHRDALRPKRSDELYSYWNVLLTSICAKRFENECKQIYISHFSDQNRNTPKKTEGN